jgi:polysaccharide pyruvyl transferase WcaK-like protein
MRILVTNDTINYPHHGCFATSTALRRLLHERFPHAQISGNDMPSRNVLECLPIGVSRRQLMKQIIPFSPPLPDLVVMNGEGTLHACTRQVKKRNGAFILRLLELQQAQQQGITTWVVNHSLFTTRPDYLDLLREVYPSCAHVAVRDPHSWPVAHGLHQGTVQAADCAFLTELPPPNPISALTGAVVMTDSSSHWSRQCYHRLRSIIARLRVSGQTIYYTSIFYHGRDAYKAQQLGIPYISFPTLEALLAHLQTAAFLLTGRFHMAAFATLCAVPFVTLRANTDKNDALAAMLSLPVPCMNPAVDDADRMWQITSEAFAMRDELHDLLQAKLPRLREAARRNIPFD